MWSRIGESCVREQFADCLGEIDHAKEVLKKNIDRTWENETFLQIVEIAGNALYWRDQEISKLEATLKNVRDNVHAHFCGADILHSGLCIRIREALKEKQ